MAPTAEQGGERPVDLDLHDRIEVAMTPGPWTVSDAEPDAINGPHCPVAVAVLVGIAPNERPGIYWTSADQMAVIALRNDHAAMVAELRAARLTISTYDDPHCDHRHKCTCGSGGHPRRCLRHPLKFDAHCRELEFCARQEEKWIERKGELDAARERIAALEARETALLADLDEVLAIANHATDVIETECDDPDGNCAKVRMTLDRIHGAAHPSPTPPPSDGTRSNEP